MSEYAITVVVCTWNRAPYLERAVLKIISQSSPHPRYELVIVDNNSTDHTKVVVDAIQKIASVPVIYVFEGRQGLSHARNTGIRSARAPLVAFTDDDVEVPEDWVRNMHRAFTAHPEADFIGGRVSPIWPGSPPRWATACLGGFALQDYGEASFRVDQMNPRKCLVGANLICKRDLFDQVGFFDPKLQRVKDSIGSMEDDEFEARAVAAGKAGIYDPNVVVNVPVPADRLNKWYHRQWSLGHGRFLARARDPELESSSRRILGVPGHMYRSALNSVVKYCRAVLRSDPVTAFHHELKVLAFLGFFCNRVRGT